MINRKQLLADLKPLLKQLEADLRARCDEVAEIGARLQREYKEARDANRTGAAIEEWRADLITQVAVAWVLSCVFVRFLEDNALIAPPRISGPLHGAGDDAGLQRTRDEREHFFKSNPKQTDRDYLLSVFDDLAKLPGTKDVFGAHNVALAYGDWLSGDAAQKLIEFFQKIDADGSGEIVHDFTDANWDTRFLGDLYQDLSEAARKKYALLQTPIFVEEFILDRTLELAINEFGLDAPPLKDSDGKEISKPGFRMIDPTCGSGHFLLGAFDRILNHWRKKEPAASDRELVNRAVASVHGVDLNPYAVAIARFRLLIAAMRECHITTLKDAPAFVFNLACGDSLLHGERWETRGIQGTLLGDDAAAKVLEHVYQAEDRDALVRILRHGQYHVVVGNPPYITVKDAALSEAYRRRYGSCHRKYALSVPFFERFFDLAVAPESAEVSKAGFVGKITANSFMKREFGKKLIESYLPRWDLTHVIDSSLAYIPGHGTPTVILFGRHRAIVANTLRLVGAIQREDGQPEPPESGKVWQAILAQIDLKGSVSEFVSVTDSPREGFHKHPWSIGGGGAAELKETLDQIAEDSNGCVLDEIADSIGITSFTLEDDIYLLPRNAAVRRALEPTTIRPMVVGDMIRDWEWREDEVAAFPYDAEFRPIKPDSTHSTLRYLWMGRTCLANNFLFGRQTKVEAGLAWYEYGRLTSHKLRTPLSIAFVEVATQNHFVLDRGGKVFKQTAPVIKLPTGCSENDHLALLGLLNSAAVGFWMRQVCHDKGGGGIGGGIAAEAWERFFAFNGTKMEQLPVPWSDSSDGADNPLRAAVMGVARDIDTLAQARAQQLPNAILSARKGTAITRAELDSAMSKADGLLWRMIAKQEELDWLIYRAYGLLEDTKAEYPDAPSINLGERAFEIVIARKMEAGTLQTEWFRRHGSTPITTIPTHWPEAYKKVVDHRIALIEAGPKQDKDIALIEQLEYKRRWNTDSWKEMEERALREWLLDRLESYFDLDGRMNAAKHATAHTSLHEPRLTSTAQLADITRRDRDFMQVAELFTARQDFDVAALIAERVTAESVPALPVLRYKPSGLEKRVVWERTWDLQREEDRLEALREAARAKIKAAETAVIARSLQDEHDLVQDLRDSARSAHEEVCEKYFPKQIPSDVKYPKSFWHDLLARGDTAGYKLVTEAEKAQLSFEKCENAFRKSLFAICSDDKEWIEATAALEAVPPNPQIDVPPRYTSADFKSSNFWRLRGKLDVPKERWVSFPNCEGEDGSLVIAWAGYGHLQLARAIAERYELAKEHEGRKLVPLLVAIGQLIPWLKQWHNDLDPVFNQRMGDYFEGYLAEEAKALGMSVADVMAWKPPERKALKRKSNVVRASNRTLGKVSQKLPPKAGSLEG